MSTLNAAVAQWIEYWPPKPRVVGSIPASRTNCPSASPCRRCEAKGSIHLPIRVVILHFQGQGIQQVAGLSGDVGGQAHSGFDRHLG